ncbi:MAG: ATP-binding protein [bacterium]
MAEQPQPGTFLRPRARMLRTLGEELISNELVAVIEMVKNAYDADATRVLIKFTPPLEVGKGQIEVVDNGHGMDLRTVKTVWMEPATPSKRLNERTDKLKRRYLGQKGIGRFASSRLADQLEVVSRLEGTDREVYAIFDWTQFEDERKYLDEVIVLWESRKPSEICPGSLVEALWKNERKRPSPGALSRGTILRMTNLKQTWEAKQFEDLRRGLARLVSPQASKEQDFEIELSLPPEFSQYSSKVEPVDILKYPHYMIHALIEGDGSYKIRCRILVGGIEQDFKGRFVSVKNVRGRFELRDFDPKEKEMPENIRNIECGPFELELRAWERDELGNVVQKTNSTINDIKRDLDSVAGINVYRDGFRVLPYGEPDDDSFKLERRRVQKPAHRLSNNQVYGTVAISADNNPGLVDQSNRQGLQENQAFEDFRDVISLTLLKLEEMRWKSKPHAKGKKAVGGIFAGFDLAPIADYLAKTLPSDAKAKEVIKATEDALDDQLKEIQTVLGRYQRLATLGQLIDHVLHEGRQPIASINNEAELGLDDIKLSNEIQKELASLFVRRFTTIRKQGDVVATAFRRMEPFGGRKRGRPNQLYLEEIIRDAFAVFENDLTKLNIRKTLPNSQTLVRVDPAEIQEVILNLLLNSLYWLEQVPVSKREVDVSVIRKDTDNVEIMFSDSGPGIQTENRELIFEPYFSTKPNGVGLGLSIVGEIVSDYYNGSIELLARGPLRGASFLITLRKRV